MGLFKKKAGGTLFGNLLRKAGSMALPGVLGTGANMIPIGGTVPVDPDTQAETFRKANEAANALLSTDSGFTKWIKENVALVGLGLATVGGLFYAYSNGMLSKSSKKRGY